MGANGELPWCDCKVAFDVNDGAAIWAALEDSANLPLGWSLENTDSSGARLVAIFQVEGLLTVEDGERVLAAIARAEARS